MSHHGLPHLSSPFALCAGLDNLPLPLCPAHTSSQLTHFKIPLCASELIACELGDGFLLTPHPKGCKAALKSHQKSVLPTCPEEGAPLHLPGWKDGLSPSAGQEDRGLKLLPKAGVTDQCCQSVLNSGYLKGGERIIVIYFSTRKSAAPTGANLAVSIDSFFCFLCSFFFFPAHCYCTH